MKIIVALMLLVSVSMFAKTDYKKVTTKGITIEVPTDWNRMGSKDQWLQTGVGNNVNIIIENTSMNLNAYLKLSKKNMLGSIPTYKVISESKVTLDGKKAIVLLGTFKMQGSLLKMYSVLIDNGNKKIVLTVGGLEKNFNKYNFIFKHIYNSFKGSIIFDSLNVSKNSSPIKKYQRVSIWVPTSWSKKTEKMWFDPVTFSSANFTTEARPKMTLPEYMKVAKVTMKKMIPTYKLLSEKNIVLNGRKASILLGEFTQNSVEIKIYSVIIDVDGTKYVLSVGGLKDKFFEMDPIFKKIINSYKAR